MKNGLKELILRRKTEEEEIHCLEGEDTVRGQCSKSKGQQNQIVKKDKEERKKVWKRESQLVGQFWGQ